MRLTDGSLVVVDYPGAVSTILGGINERGDVTGAYVDSGGAEHAFLKRQGSAAFTSFDAPGAVGTEGHYMNDRGQVAGVFCPSTSCLAPGPQHGYIRLKDGSFTLVDFPGALLTAGGGINSSGSVVGDYFRPDFSRHGFLRTP